MKNNTQARRKPRKGPKQKRRLPTFSSHGIGMLLIGMVVGSVATALYLGSVSEHQPPLGSGLKHLIDQSKRAAQAQEKATEATASEQQPTTTAVATQTDLDFYTVLPEIERVLTDDIPVQAVAVKQEPAKVKPEEVAVNQPKSKSDKPPQPSNDAGFFMLQAGSYTRQADADALKAKLALSGLTSSIQEVTIQNRGHFFRVRLGPYADTASLKRADTKLAQLGIDGLRLKVSRSR